MQHSILLVEDDADIGEMVRDQLEREGYRVIRAHDGEEAERLLKEAEAPFDLILLDLMLPKRSGLDLLQWIRRDSVVPVLILSAKDSDLDKALGLGFGADDYIAKPFSMIELVARVKAALRRAKQYSAPDEQAAGPAVLRLMDLVIDPDNFTVIKDGRTIRLTAKEFQILKLFASHPNRVYTKEQIYQLVWNDHYYGDDNVINVHMRRLREKIEDNPSQPRYIKTLWGIGYKAGGSQP